MNNNPLRRSFRILGNAGQNATIRQMLTEQGFHFEPEPFSPLAFRLLEEPFPLGRSLAAFFGYLYIQDRSSMLPPLALCPPKGAVLVDMCASPGSKTGLLAQLTGPEGLVLGNEPNPARLATLRRNLQQMNLFQTVSCCSSGDQLPLPEAFCDCILLDPPCSGWGTTERNPNVLKLWKGDKVKPLIHLQRALLHKAAAMLRPGGRLIYSTCTTNVEENEAQVRYARDELGLRPVPLEPFPGFTYESPAFSDTSGVLRVDEEASDAQGFFLAAFTKDSPATTPMDLVPVGAPAPWTPLDEQELLRNGLDPRLLPPGQAGIFKDTVHMLPEKALTHLPSNLRWQGLVLGKYTSGRFRPNGRLHACLNPDGGQDLPRLETDSLEAVKGLLEGRALQTDLPPGRAGLFWNILPLGIVTIKGGRALWTER